MNDPDLSSHRAAASRSASFRFAFAGVRLMLLSQPNARLHAGATLLVVIVGSWLGLGRVEWALLVLVMGLVWVAESINTAIEAVVDLASPELHPLAKRAKDVAAAAVLAGALTAIIVGLLILGPPLWTKLGFVGGST